MRGCRAQRGADNADDALMAAAAQVLSPGTTSHSTSPGPEVPRCSVGVLITSSFRVPRALMRGRTVSPHSGADRRVL